MGEIVERPFRVTPTGAGTVGGEARGCRAGGCYAHGRRDGWLKHWPRYHLQELRPRAQGRLEGMPAVDAQLAVTPTGAGTVGVGRVAGVIPPGYAHGRRDGWGGPLADAYLRELRPRAQGRLGAEHCPRSLAMRYAHGRRDGWFRQTSGVTPTGAGTVGDGSVVNNTNAALIDAGMIGEARPCRS